MKFRVSIVGIMLVVALVALECVAIRSFLPFRMGRLLLLAVLPMANVLIAVIIRARAGRRLGISRPFGLGFAVSGFVALGVYVSLILAFPDKVAHALTDPILAFGLLDKGTAAGLVKHMMLGFAWSQTPVLAPALLGGCLYRLWLAGASLRSAPATRSPLPLGIKGREPATTRLVDPATSR